jgi:hypothetical protein
MAGGHNYRFMQDPIAYLRAVAFSTAKVSTARDIAAGRNLWLTIKDPDAAAESTHRFNFQEGRRNGVFLMVDERPDKRYFKRQRTRINAYWLAQGGGITMDPAPAVSVIIFTAEITGCSIRVASHGGTFIIRHVEGGALKINAQWTGVDRANTVAELVFDNTVTTYGANTQTYGAAAIAMAQANAVVYYDGVNWQIICQRINRNPLPDSIPSLRPPLVNAVTLLQF